MKIYTILKKLNNVLSKLVPIVASSKLRGPIRDNALHIIIGYNILKKLIGERAANGVLSISRSKELSKLLEHPRVEDAILKNRMVANEY